MIDPLKPPAVSAPRFDPDVDAWILSRYADVVAAFRHPQLHPASADGEAHRAFRQAASSRFGGEMVDLPDLPRSKAQSASHVDLLHDVAEPWCTAVAANVTGI